jgi:hypothetical protein
MAADKTNKRARKAQAGQDDIALKQRSEARSERRFEPRSSPTAVLSVLLLSVAAVLVGAGTYGQFLRDETLGPHKSAPWLLAGGAALLLGVALFGQRLAQPVRVGDAGVGVEKGPNELERIGWYEIKRILLSDRAVTVQGNATSITLPLPAHRDAAARLLAEARSRIPAKVEGTPSADLEKIDERAGEVVALEPPQVAGLKCASSGKLIAFEKDARLCGRCGEVYHKDSVPKRCQTCDARLR